MSLCYFSLVSHYTRNAILNITARDYGSTAQVFFYKMNRSASIWAFSLLIKLKCMKTNKLKSAVC